MRCAAGRIVEFFSTAGRGLRAALLAGAFLAALLAPPKPAQAICIPCIDVCPLVKDVQFAIQVVAVEHAQTWLEFETRFLMHELFLKYIVFQFHILPTLAHMTEQMTAAAMHQTLAIGMFIDAGQQMETLRTFQRLTAEAHKDYHPSTGMCTIGTNVRSLAAADARAAVVKSALDEHSLRRQLGSANTSASEGPARDRENRLNLFAARFCDRNENNRIPTKVRTGLGLLCSAAIAPATINRDTDFAGSVLFERTLAVDPVNGGLDANEPDIFAMSSYLYGHEPLSPIASALLDREDNRDEYLDFRAIVAKRSIAANAFHSLVSLKTMGSAAPTGAGAPASAGGSDDTRATMAVLLEELGMDAAEIEQFLGTRPSYLAQLELLAKKMYQRTGFYVDLYDKPANVERKGVAMQAIGLMLDRDIYYSQLRSESIMSMLLELRLVGAQEAVVNNIGKLQRTGN